MYQTINTSTKFAYRPYKIWTAKSPFPLQ